MKIDDTEQKPITEQTETGPVTVKTPVAAPKTAPAPKKTTPPAKKAKTTGAKTMKTPKKAKAKKAATKKGATTRVTFSKDDVIVVTSKKNPRREGSPRHKRYEAVLACHGKTVGEFDKRKGNRGTLHFMIKSGLGHVKAAKKAA
jgi:hypothetical protein